MSKAAKTPTEKRTIGIIIGVCIFIIAVAIITSQTSTSTTSKSSTAEEIQNCENTKENQLYKQLLAQEKAAPGLSGGIVSSLATLAQEVQKQQFRCEAGLPAD